MEPVEVGICSSHINEQGKSDEIARCNQPGRIPILSSISRTKELLIAFHTELRLTWIWDRWERRYRLIAIICSDLGNNSAVTSHAVAGYGFVSEAHRKMFSSHSRQLFVDVSEHIEMGSVLLCGRVYIVACSVSPSPVITYTLDTSVARGCIRKDHGDVVLFCIRPKTTLLWCITMSTF